MRLRRRAAALVMLVCLFIFGAVGVVWLHVGDAVPVSAPGSETDGRDTRGHEAISLTADRSVESASEGTGLPSPESEPVADTNPVNSAEQRVPLCVKFQDREGAPVANIPLRWKALDAREGRGLQRRSAGHTEWQSLWAGATAAAADANGVWHSSGPPSGLVLLEIDSPQWSLATDGRGWFSGIPAGTQVVAVWLISHQPVEVAVKLSPRLDVHVAIEYADGIPFRGRASWRVTDSRNAILGAGVEDDANGVLRSISLPAGSDLVVVATSERAGFKGRSVFKFDAVVVASTPLTCRIDAHEGPAPSGLQLDCSAFGPDAAGTIGIYTEHGLELQRIPYIGPGSHRTRPLPLAGSVSVIVCGTHAWRSEIIPLTEGEFSVVVVPALAPGEIEFKVVDSAGNPIPSPVVVAHKSRRVSWADPVPTRAVSSKDGMLAWGDKGGRVVFTGVAPGQGEYFVEARGYCRKTISVNVPPAGRAVLPDVQLDQAAAAIEVSLVNAGDSEYSATLFFPASPPLFPLKQFEKGKAEFTDLSGGEYIVFVRDSTSPYGWTKRISVDGGDAGKIEIDVSKPRGKQ